MLIQLTHAGKNYQCDLAQPIDIAIPAGQVKCFYATDFEARPYVSGDFVGSVVAGAPVNFFDLQINPHGNGTHTECLGHITKQQELVNDHLQQFHFVAQVVSVALTKQPNGDQIITKTALQTACPDTLPDAIIIRTLPNTTQKLTMDYSGTNPPYLEVAAVQFLVEAGIRHLLIDLPSVDREVDEGKLLAHHLFWNVAAQAAKDNTRSDCTITELIYVPDEVQDGLYLLNLQLPAIPLDAVPSKPTLYALFAV
ncbi:MAG: cyclase family protein [Bacteroidota bacterium]